MRAQRNFILCLILLFCSSLTFGKNFLGETLQINTHFRSLTGKPTWLLIVRDVDSGQVSPYLFDIRKNDNFWLAFTFGRAYRVTASTLKFGPYAVIHNFCHLQNGILTGKSMAITLSGDLTPNPEDFNCSVLKYDDSAFPLVTHSNL